VKVTGKEVFNNACNNCHTTSKNNRLCTEDKKIRNKVQDNCVSCHMPRSGSIDIPHVSVHDHFIRKPLKKEEVKKMKEFIGLYPVNEKNPDSKTKAKAYIQQYDKFEYNTVFLDSAKKYLSDKNISDVKENFEILIHLYFIKKDYSQILKYVNRLGADNVRTNILTKRSWSNDHAWTLYRIGESYYNSSDLTNAYLFYKKADELAPYNPEFKNKLGAVLMSQSKIKEAMNIFETTLTENPKFVPALTNLGYAYLVSGNSAKAQALYEKALKFDPDYEPLLMNVAGLKAYQKDYKAALEILKKVLKKNPENRQAKQVTEQLKALN
jgi:tetratricopeptide (TPR) repeat protein